MGAVAEQLTYAQYLALAASSDETLEYHDGVVVAMEAPTPAHARIVGQLLRVLARSNKSDCGALPPGLKVRIEATNRTLVPDVTVVCGELEYSVLDQHAITNPTVVFEVLSPSTEAYDQGPKLYQYRRLASLREYVVVAQDRRFASVCRRVGDLWAFEDIEAGGVLKLEGLELELALDDLYSDTFGVVVP
ncbi:MAG: Uma2 family endonuclease [Enhygromyxa sp.]